MNTFIKLTLTNGDRPVFVNVRYISGVFENRPVKNETVINMSSGAKYVVKERADDIMARLGWKNEEGSCSAHDFESDQEDDFTTKYATWIIAYCPDTDEFFATNQRSFFWQYTEEFASEKDAVAFFEGNVKKFISVKKEIRRKVAGDHTPSNRVWLSNTNKVYTEEV